MRIGNWLLILLGVFSAIPVMAQNAERNYRLPKGLTEVDYDQSKIIVRLRLNLQENSSAFRINPGKSRGMDDLVALSGSASYKSILNNANGTTSRQKSHKLDGIFKVFLTENQSPLEVINTFLKYPEVLYAEPYFNYRPIFIPNDPESKTNKNQGPYLSLIQAYDAWNLSKADTSLIIAILDTGTKLNHEDLEDNLFINYEDPVNGIDDDADGLVDNYFGYDFADDDNDPTADTNGHGAEVAGVSNATTNNAIGIAGIGFNSRYMPLKIFTSADDTFANGFEAIIFAADKGASVINLSWGGPDSYSQFGQDAVNYAVLEKDAVVVAAAGNTTGEFDFYPASFDNVLSVGATNNLDQKSDFATYSYKIDLMAPGEDIYSTRQDGSYGANSGTSFSSPLVAGAAALLRTYSPELNAQQVMEKIRVTSDDIYGVSSNQNFEYLLGKGRLNILKALTDNISPAVRFENIVYDNGSGQHAYYEDTVKIQGDFKNFLQPTQNLTVTLSTSSEYVTLLDSVVNPGLIGTLEITEPETFAFQIVLSEDLPPDTSIVFHLQYKDGFYEDFQNFTITSSPDYATIENGTVATTISGNGNLGYNLDGYSEGLGFEYKGEKILSHFGLLIGGKSSDQLSNNSLTIVESNQRDSDFIPIQNLRFYNNSIAETEVRSIFNEVSSLTNPLNVKVEQKLFTPAESLDNFMILEYRIINTSGSMIDTLYTSLFADWDLIDSNLNIARWVDNDSLGYIYFPQSDSLYAGIALLTNQAPIHNAVMFSDLGDTISREEKHGYISNGVANNGMGDLGMEGDVSHFVGGIIADLDINQAEKITLSFVVAESLNEMIVAVDSARSFYARYLTSPPIEYIAFTCEGDSALIDPPGTLYDFYADVNLDSLIYSGESFYTPIINESLTFYAINRDSAYASDISRMVAETKPLNVNFEYQPDTLFLDESGNYQVHFSDLSVDAIEWSWDFNNGFSSSVKNPVSSFFDVGNYDVELVVKNDVGCIESISKTIQVLQRAPMPQVDSQLICKTDTVIIDPENAATIRVYTDPLLSNKIFEGDSFTSGPILSDTSFFVTNMDTGIESLPSESIVEITDLEATFRFSVDTLDFSRKYLLNLHNNSLNADGYSWSINNTSFSNSNNPQVDYTGLFDFDIELVANDSLGCMDTATVNIQTKVSSKPIIENPNLLCINSSIELIPGNGSIFFFYADSNLDSLIYKGSRLILDSLQITKDIFVISMDSLFDSDTLIIPINVSSLNADFSFTPDSLNLIEGNTVQFESLSNDASSWFWDFDNGLQDSIASPVSTFEDPGLYSIYLSVKDSINCFASQEQLLPVVSILALEEKLNNVFKIYPNPAKTAPLLSLELPTEFSGNSIVEIFTSSGRLFFQKSVELLNGSAQLSPVQIGPGLYYVRIRNDREYFVQKLLVTH